MARYNLHHRRRGFPLARQKVWLQRRFGAPVAGGRGYKGFGCARLDPYLNLDPGTMSPYQHGEVFRDR